MTDDTKPAPSPMSDSLGGKTIKALWALGTVSLVAGGVSVFWTPSGPNGVGSAALIAVGVVLIVLASGRRLPSSLEWGDKKVVYDAGRRDGLVEGITSGVAVGAEAVKQIVERDAPEARSAVEVAFGDVIQNVTDRAATEKATRDLHAWALATERWQRMLYRRPGSTSAQGLQELLDSLTREDVDARVRQAEDDAEE